MSAAKLATNSHRLQDHCAQQYPSTTLRNAPGSDDNAANRGVMFGADEGALMNVRRTIGLVAVVVSISGCGGDEKSGASSGSSKSTSSAAGSTAAGSTAAASNTGASAVAPTGSARAFKFADLYWNDGMKKMQTELGQECDDKAAEEFTACMEKACNDVAKQCHGEKAEEGEFAGACKEQDQCSVACKEDDLDCLSKCLNEGCMNCGIEKVSACLMSNSGLMGETNPCKSPCKPK